MKILHLVKTSVGATWAYRLTRDLVKSGVEVHVAMPTNGPLVEQYKNAGIIVHELSYSIKNLFKTIKKLRRIVNKVQPDIIHSHFVLTTLIMRLALRSYNIPRVFQVPGPLHLEHYIYRKMDLMTAQRYVDFWIPTCKWSYETYKTNGISEDRLFITYYGGDLVDKEYPKGVLRSELRLDQEDVVVGMVAYMYAPKKYLGEKRGLKGHEDLIDAISLIQDRYPKLHLVFIGGHWVGAEKYEKQLMSYGYKKVRNIHFLGTRKNVPELYQDFNVVVHPSHSENLGGAAESLMLAIPTIASNVGGFPDIVIPEQTGYLVPPSDPQAIAETLEYVMSHPNEAKRLANNGKRILHSLLDAKKTSNDVFNFYKLIIQRYNNIKKQ